MKPENAQSTEQRPDARTVELSAKKPWVEPEITWHKPLQEVSLGVQCSTTIPSCSPGVDPFA